MTKEENISVQRVNKFWCEICDDEANYVIWKQNMGNPIYICKKCLDTINEKVKEIDNEN